MTDWPKPTRTDIHELHRREDEYYVQYHLHHPWVVKPRAVSEPGGVRATDSTWCSIVSNAEEPARIADDMRQAMASHIVHLHNAWVSLHENDPPPEV